MQNFPPPGPGYAPPPGQSPAPKRSKTPWIIAGVGCLVVGGILLIAIVGGLALIGSRVQPARPVEAPPAAPTSGTRQYVNSREGREGALAENYVDFSFYYPEDWEFVPNQTKNFVKLQRSDEQGTTLENFAVGWISATGTSVDKQLMPRLAQQFSAQFGASFQNFEKVSEGETKIGPYEGYELKFTAQLPGTPKGQSTLYGRLALLPPPAGQKKGVALIMLATDLAPEINSVDDVGVKGGLPVILDSFRFGQP